MENKEKIQLIEETTEQITKKFGKGSIMKLGQSDNDFNMGAISTGALSLDIALGIGGIPKGRMIEIYGPESSGKTTMALQTVAECQKKGGIAAYIDAENALDPTYASALGVDVDNLLISQPDTGEQALQIAYMLAHSSAVDIIVIDSVAALVPKAELQGEMGEATIGLRARLLSQALPKLAGELAKTNTACLFINQLRQKIGVMFGNPETTPGGMALKFAASVRMDIRRVSWINDSDRNAIGSHVRVKVVKNKVAPPFRQAEFDLMFGSGVSKSGCVLDMAIESGVCSRAGAWYNYNDLKLGQGRESAKMTLEQNPELFNEIEIKVLRHFGLLETQESEQTPITNNNSEEKSKNTSKSSK